MKSFWRKVDFRVTVFYWSGNRYAVIFILFFIVAANRLQGTCTHTVNTGFNGSFVELIDNKEFAGTLNAKAIFKPVVIREAPTNESSIVSTKRGELKIFFINRPGGADKMMSVSSENGIEWSISEKEFDLPGQAYYANQVIEDKEGSLHCVFHIQGKGDKGYNGRHYNLWYSHKNSGTTGWKEPKEIYNGYVGSIRNFMQLESGRLLMTFGKAVPERSEKPRNNMADYGWNEIMALYSDDNGESWNSSKNMLEIKIDPDKHTRYGAIEPDVMQLKNGTLWMLIRTNKGVLYQSFSSDFGETWSEPEPAQFISSDSPSHFLRLKDRRIIVFFNMNQRWDDPNSYAFGGREVLHAAISGDDGQTWKGFREVLRASEEKNGIRGDRGTAYPSAAETNDGKVLLVSGQGESKSIAIFDPDWLEQDCITEDVGINPNEWTLFGSTDVLSKEFLKKDNKIRFLVETMSGYSQHPEVVWNFPATPVGELKMEIEFVNHCPQLYISLTDHFSISGDSLASDHSIFSFILNNTYKKEKKIPIKIKWNVKQRKAEFFIFDKKVSETYIQRIPAFGINYFRVGIPANENFGKWGFLLNSITIFKNE